MNGRPSAPAAERNRGAILGVLQKELDERSHVLEIGSGTGQHAVHVGASMPGLTWQTSDVIDNHPAILAWLADAGLSNVLAPLQLDVRSAAIPPASYDAVFSANTAHIMSLGEVKRMFEIAAGALRGQGVFLLYGPFRQNGRFNTASNAAFHDSLRLGHPHMGIRDLEELDQLAQAGKLVRQRLYAMPANNHMVVWTCAEQKTNDGS